MTYTVVILQDGETARLACATLEESQQVRQSFINYGKCQEVRIEIKEQQDEYGEDITYAALKEIRDEIKEHFGIE